MAIRKQTEAAKEKIKKTQEEWVSPLRAEPGTKGEGRFYRIVVRPKNEFVTFRIQDVGKKGRIERLAGKRSSGSWDTQAWLISKDDAHLEGGNLVPDTSDAREVIEKLPTKPHHIRADIFEARDRKNIKKAQKARWRYSM